MYSIHTCKCAFTKVCTCAFFFNNVACQYLEHSALKFILDPRPGTTRWWLQQCKKRSLQHNDLRISISLERLPQSRVSYHRWSFSTKHHKDLSFIPQINTNMAKKRIGRKIVRIWIYGFIITGWWFQPLWKILVSWDYYSQYMEK